MSNNLGQSSDSITDEFTPRIKQQLHSLFGCKNVSELSERYCEFFNFDTMDIRHHDGEENSYFRETAEIFYKDSNLSPLSISIIYSPQIDNDISFFREFYSSSNFSKKIIDNWTAKSCQLYFIAGNKKIAWVHFMDGKKTTLQLDINELDSIPAYVYEKIIQLKQDRISFYQCTKTQYLPDYSFLLSNSQLEENFLQFLDNLKRSLIVKIIQDKEILKLIDIKFNLGRFNILESLKEKYLFEIITNITNYIIIQGVVERYHSTRFPSFFRADSENSFNVRKEDRKQFNKRLESRKSLRSRSPSPQTINSQQEKNIGSDSINKQDLFQEFRGSDTFQIILSDTIFVSELLSLLGIHTQNLIDRYYDSTLHGFRYQDITITTIQNTFEMVLHDRVSIIPETNSTSGYSINVKKSKLKKKQIGAYFTPPELADKLVKTSLEVLVVKNIIEPMQDLLIRLKEVPEDSEVFFDKIQSYLVQLVNLRICDPAMGIGVFLYSLSAFLSYLYFPMQLIANNLTQLYHTRAEELFDTLGISFFNTPVYSLKEHAKWEQYIMKNMLYGVDLESKTVYLANQLLLPSLSLITEEGERIYSSHLNSAGLNLKQGNALISPIVLTVEATKKLRVEYQKELVSLLSLKRKIKNSIDQEEVALYLNGVKQIKDILYNQLIKKYLIKDKEGKSSNEHLFSYTQLNDKRLAPFVWQLEFPEVFFESSGKAKERKKQGFSLVIGNPPWEKWKPHANEWLSSYKVNDDRLKTNKRINQLLESDKGLEIDYSLYNEFYLTSAKYFKIRFKEYRGKTGDLNLYKLFMEQFYRLTHDLYSFIVPGSILGDKGGIALRRMMIEQSKVIYLLEIVSSRKDKDSFFPHIFSGTSILAGIFKKYEKTDQFLFRYDVRKISELKFSEMNILRQLDINSLERKEFSKLAKEYKLFLLGSKEIIQYSQNYIIPVIKDSRELQILEKMYSFPVLSHSKWNCKTTRGLDVSLDRGYFNSIRTAIPILEGKHIMRFGYSLKKIRWWLDEENKDKGKLFGKEYIAWRGISRKKDRRMMKAIYVTSETRMEITNSLKAIIDLPEGSHRYVCAVLNSIPFEYRIRQLCYGPNITQYLLEDMPIPLFDENNTLHSHLVKKVKEFEQIAIKWADEKMINPGLNIDQEGEFRYRVQLSEFDALVALIYGLNLTEFKITLNNHQDVCYEYKQAAVQNFQVLIQKFNLNPILANNTSEIDFKGSPPKINKSSSL